MAQRTFFFPLEGGMDLVTPALRIKPGRVIASKNYEPTDEGGYRRLAGDERFDGRPSPSEANYWLLDFDQGTGAEIFAGDVIVGGTSGASGEVLSLDTLSGTWNSDAAGELRLFNVVGTFVDNEALVVGGTRAQSDGVAVARSEIDTDLDETYLRAAREATRDDIGKVPGGDPINGVWIYRGTVYAFRDNYSTTVVSSAGISFTSPDTIADSGAGFGIFSPGDRIIVEDSPLNSREWDVLTANASTLTVSRTDGGQLTTEGAGATITIGVLEEAQMWQSGPAGLTKVDLGNYLEISAGTAAFTEGATVTGSPSGATATVISAGITSGSFTGTDAVGRLYVSNISGTFTASDTLVDDGAIPAAADCDSGATAVSLPPGGKYEFRNYNFFGSIATMSMWGVNGVGRGFRYNQDTGFTYVHITGLAESVDKPTHLEAHKKHLFYSIGSEVQHSSTGEPLIWDAITGALALSTGDTIVSLQTNKADILSVFNRNRTYLLYGTSILDWDLVNYSLNRGAIEWSVQDIGVSIYTDDRGVHMIGATDAYGDMSADTLSQLVDPFIQETKPLIVDSVRIKSKSQYRYFNSDKTGLILRIDGKKREFMPFELENRVYSICAEEDTDGSERVFYGSDTGYIYEAEKGESFDGEEIVYNLRLAYCHCSSPRQQKRFHKATVQIDGPDDPGLSYSPDFSYGGPGQPQPHTAQSEVSSGGIWGVDLWGQFNWDGAIIGEAEAYITGIGINVSLLIQGSSNYERTHIIEGVTYNYVMRGLKR